MFHYLVLPKETQLNSPKELKRVHLGLVKEMEKVSQDLIQRLHPDTPFK